MAVQVISDLHLEGSPAYDAFEIVPRAPYLALLGDIVTVTKYRTVCLAFLTRQLKQFRAVLFVPGDSDAHRSNWPDTIAFLRAFELGIRNNPALGEFVLLDRAVFRLPDTNVVILGCSLFSYIAPESRTAPGVYVKDFSAIDGWNIDAHNEAHRRDLGWLNAQVTLLEESDVRVMVLSHWSPSLDARAVDPRLAWGPFTSAFSTDLSGEACFRSSKVKVWAFGHTHYNCDFTLEREGGAGKLRLLTNQRGYPLSPADGYDGEKTVEI